MSEVYLGSWIDHSRNSILGATITTSSYWGTLLISALAIIVTAAGSAVWTICAFALHQGFALPTPIDPLSLQTQVALRNSGTALSTAWELIKIGHAGRETIRKSRLRAWSLALIPLSVLAIFATAGIFVAKVSIPAYQISQVLVKSGNCGLVSANTKTTAGVFALSNKIANDTQVAREYSNRCYNSPPGSLGCSILPIQSLPYNTSSTTCPFPGPGRCVTGDREAFQMDTGILDSHVHLGINAPTSDRVSFQMRTTCSVITTRGLTNTSFDTTSRDGSLLIQYNLGHLVDGTYVFSNHTFSYLTRSVNDSIAYTILSAFSLLGESGVWQPSDQFNRTDADVNVHFFAPNSVVYAGPVFDPFFSANGTNIEGDVTSTPLYLPDAYIHVMGCADQRRICNAVTGACTPLTGLYQVEYKSLGLNAAQTATAARLILGWANSDTYNVVSGQNGNALRATAKLYQLFSPVLPDNQWQVELRGWFETSLAALQFAIVDFPTNIWATGAAGPIGVTAPQSGADPNSNALKSQCAQQKVQSTDSYQSFSTLGVSITAGVSALLILISWILECSVRKVRLRQGENGKSYHKLLAYVADGKQQLARRALEDDARDGWKSGLNEIPVRAGPTLEIIGPAIEKDGFIQRANHIAQNGVIELQDQAQPTASCSV